MNLDKIILIGKFIVAVISFIATEVLPFIAGL